MTGADEVGLLLDRAAAWREAGHGLALATVVRAWGSAPRRPGAWLLVRDDGLFEGSVSGGCVEAEVIAAARRRIGAGGGELLEFGVADATAWAAGLACGGRISVLVQAIDDSGFPPALFEHIVRERAAGRPAGLVTSLATMQTRAGSDPADGEHVQRIDPPQRLILIGAVHIAQMLVPLAGTLGWRTHVVDPRAAFAAGPRFAGLEIDPRWPDEALADWEPDAATAVVALTHDPKIDDPGLAAALRTPAYYVGALGSRRTHASRLVRLAGLGFDAPALARIDGPVGLPIGAAGPAEIAVAIAAGIIAAWRGRA
jgi:xanthine dehydrogenase accessory factor